MFFPRMLLAPLFATGFLLAAPPCFAQASLDAQLKPLLARYELPALAAAVARDGKIVSAGAVGTRRAGADVPVTINDRFHIGSDTKAMTALMAAMLVEQGRLRWDSTPADVFPELADGMSSGCRAITLTQLLSHGSGLTDGEFDKLLEQSLMQEDNLDELRYDMLKKRVRAPLKGKPGQFSYSNLGYLMVGAMIERIEKSSWEELVIGKVFEPLGMKTAGLGHQCSVGLVDSALPHRYVAGKPKPMLAGSPGDMPMILGPAGTAYMSVLDFAAWASWNAGEGRRGPVLVTSETLRKLHTPVIHAVIAHAPPGTPPSGEYGMGWGVVTRKWAPRPLLYHGGSNTMNLAHIWLDTELDLAIVIMTNISHAKAEEALQELIEALYKSAAGPAGAEAAKP